jgi:predicted negative regulator of RcsB-dependent stress response
VLKYGNTKTSFFLLALITTIGFHSFNSAAASHYREMSINDDTLDIEIVTQPSPGDNVTTLDLVADEINLASSINHLLSNIHQVYFVKSSLQTSQQLNNFSGDIVVNSNQNDSKTTEQKQLKYNKNLRIIQIISLSFFLLLFIPFGIFYPFLLLYKKLLNVDQKESIQLSVNNTSPFYQPVTTENYNFKQQEDNSQAAISKLQIACSASDNQLRQKLAQINSNNDLQSEQAIAELMRQNLAVLIKQQHWVHSSFSVLNLPLEEIQTEFNVIACNEKNKFFNQELSLINNGQSTQAAKKNQNKTGYGYVVFTLIICTSRPLSLFGQIYTKEQLTQSLIKLSKLQKDELIKFELLWNPQSEDEYISNEQLLMEYGDMIRLL